MGHSSAITNQRFSHAPGSPIRTQNTGMLHDILASERFWQLLERVDWRSMAAFFLPLLIYTFTLAPTIYNLDSAELTTAAGSGGLVRSTGYPLYLAFGTLWSKLPIGDVGYRMNLFSAVCGASTILLAERILRRWHVGPWATFGSLGLLATGVYFWGLSLVAEVYTLHTALMAGIILSLLRWRDRPTPTRLGFSGLLFGLGLSHHLATTLLIPAAMVFVLSVSPGSVIKPRSLLSALGGLLVGLSPYLLLPLRQLGSPVFNYVGVYDANLVFHQVDLLTVSGMWWLVTGQSFSGQMFAYRGWEIWEQTRNFMQELWRAFFAIGIGPALLGLGLAFRSTRQAFTKNGAHVDWRAGLLLVLMFIGNAGFYINYRVIDKDTMYLPTYLIWAIWLGIGLQALLNWVKTATSPQTRDRSQFILHAAIVTGVLLALIWNWKIVDLGRDWSTRQRGETILAQVEQGAVVFGWWDTVPVLQYLQFVEGQRLDILAINRFLISPEDLLVAVEKEAHYRTVYIDSIPSGLSRTLKAQKIDQLFRIQPLQPTIEPDSLPGSSP
jgi:hypothetical protein